MSDDDAQLLEVEIRPLAKGVWIPKLQGQRAMMLLAVVMALVAAVVTWVLARPLDGALPIVGLVVVAVVELGVAVSIVPRGWKAIGPVGRAIGRNAMKRWPATVLLLVGAGLLVLSAVSPFLSTKTPKVTVVAPAPMPTKWFFIGGENPQLVTRVEADRLCADQGSRLPTLEELVQLKPAPRTTREEGVWLRKAPEESPLATRVRFGGETERSMTLLSGDAGQAVGLCVGD